MSEMSILKQCHRFLGALAMGVIVTSAGVSAQDKSVRPGINDSFRDPDVKSFVERFEIESREVFHEREKILKTCSVQPGMVVADIGAGTGLFTRMFSKAVGDKGRVLAVDISQKFLDHIIVRSREIGQRNVETVLCSDDSVKLPEKVVDLAFISDTYHHFEYPSKTMKSLLTSLKPGGRLVVIDFHRIEGKSSDFVMGHVRAGQEVFEKEILDCGFRKVSEEKDLLKENYFLVFEKPGQ